MTSTMGQAQKKKQLSSSMLRIMSDNPACPGFKLPEATSSASDGTNFQHLQQRSSTFSAPRFGALHMSLVRAGLSAKPPAL